MQRHEIARSSRILKSLPDKVMEVNDGPIWENFVLENLPTSDCEDSAIVNLDVSPQPS